MTPESSPIFSPFLQGIMDIPISLANALKKHNII